MTATKRKSPRATVAKTRLLCGLGASVLIAMGILGPQNLHAHGELLIRIAAVTRLIEASTNGVAELYLRRGELHREHQDWPAAEADYTRAAQLDPHLVAVDICHAQLLADSGQLDAARTKFGKAIDRSPNTGEAFVGRARVLVKLEQRAAAIADYQQALKLLPQPAAEHFLELAQALKIQQQPDKALAAINEGVKKLGPLVLLQDFALQLELEQKKHDAALARLDSILKQVQRKEDWLVQEGEIFLAIGRPDQARHSFEAALAAIKQLPWRIQQNPPLIKKQARINDALSRITNPTVPGQTENLVIVRE